MTAEIIKEIIEKQIVDLENTNNAHGIDLRKCLINPVKENYYSFDKSEIFHLWTVLEETLDRTGYKIFYDEQEDCFGLGIMTDKEELMSLGLYGDFLTTLKAM